MKTLCLGSVNVDTTYHLEHLVRKGETIHSLEQTQCIGGKGCNQALAIARAGEEVYFAAKMNRNDQWIPQQLKEEHIIVELFTGTDIPTGQAIIQVDQQGDNAIILHPSSNFSFTVKDLEYIFSPFTRGDILIIQNEINLLTEIIDMAHQKGMVIFFNPAPMNKEAMGIDYNKVNYLILNETEGMELSRFTQPERIIEMLSHKYPETTIVLTMGSEGLLYAHHNQIISVEAEKTTVVDTVAAGDTFIGYMVAMLNKGKELDTAIRIANHAAALSVQKKGASSSVPYLHELNTPLI